jgi:hypothetical protein
VGVQERREESRRKEERKASGQEAVVLVSIGDLRMDKDKDTSYTAMDDLTPKRSGRDPDTKRRLWDESTGAADPPENRGGGTEPPAAEAPSEESPFNQGGSNA